VEETICKDVNHTTSRGQGKMMPLFYLFKITPTENRMEYMTIFMIVMFFSWTKGFPGRSDGALGSYRRRALGNLKGWMLGPTLHHHEQ